MNLIGSIKIADVKQVTRQRTAVIVKQELNNHFINKFYADLGDYLRQKGYAVNFCTEAGGKLPKADLWITFGGHNSPQGTKQIVLKQYAKPFLTNQIKQVIDQAHESKQDQTTTS